MLNEIPDKFSMKFHVTFVPVRLSLTISVEFVNVN